jgi:3-methylcrotonyl-CoA carboxylase alpha subunit
VKLEIAIDGGTAREALLTRTERGATVWVDGRAHRAALRPVGRAYQLTMEDRTETVWLAVDHDVVYVHAFGRAWHIEVSDPDERGLQAAEQADLATAPMPGTVVTVAVEPGDSVESGQPLVVIESMKMHSEIVAWRDGVVERVHLRPGESFDRGAGLVALIPEKTA